MEIGAAITNLGKMNRFRRRCSWQMLYSLDLTQEGFPVLEEFIEKKRERKKKVRVVCRKNIECSHCRVQTTSSRDDTLCFMCYKLRDASPEIRELIIKAYNAPCSFCSRIDGLKHFDHINIFNKKTEILNLANTSLQEIQEEISKCQLLCKECHAKVTKHEHTTGFIRKKIQLNKLIKKGKQVEDKRKQLEIEYENIFTAFYESLKGSGGKIRRSQSQGVLEG